LSSSTLLRAGRCLISSRRTTRNSSKPIWLQARRPDHCTASDGQMRPRDVILLGLPFAARLAGSVRVPPPHGGECCHAVFGHRVRATEPVPASSPQLAIAPLRHDVLIPKQYAIKCSGGGDQIIACLGLK